MLKNFYKISLIILVLTAVSFPVLAQRSGTVTDPNSSNTSTVSPSKFNLRINSNVRNTLVSILPSGYKDGGLNGTAPFSAQLNKGNYTIRVSAAGYEPQEQNLFLNSNQTLNFNLGQEKSQLQIRSNVRDAQVVITGSGINGQIVGSAPFTAQLAKGNYNITVSAQGYLTAYKEINLNSAKNVNINLEAMTYNLTVTSNVDDAKVFIKGGDINGQLTGRTEMSTVLPLGTYRIKVNAPGYFAEEKTVQFNGSTTVDFQLRGRTGKLEVIIPNNILNYSINNPAGRISIFDNGTEINGTSMQLTPGQHTIRITSGGFASQQNINVKAGESYRIELDFGFSLFKE